MFTYYIMLAQGLVAALPLLLPTEAAGLVAHRAWPPQLWVVPGLALGIAVLAAALPAWGAYRADVSRLLSTAP